MRDSAGNKHLSLAVAEAQVKASAALSPMIRGTIGSQCDRVRMIIECEGGALADASMRCLRSEWESEMGSKRAAALEMAIVCQAMSRSLEQLDTSRLPDQVVTLVHQEFRERSEAVLSEQWEQLSSREDPTLRTMRCCLLQWIPAGIYYFAYSAIPRENVLLCPWSQKARLVHFLWFRMKGLRPTIEMHLPAQLRGHFAKTQSVESHRLVAAVIAHQPEVKGIAGSSWYCDPAVLRISPHLSFVRDLFEENGGFLHRLGPTQGAVRKALLKSRTRRRLFEEGKYIPTDYARYWARADVLRWASEQVG